MIVECYRLGRAGDKIGDQVEIADGSVFDGEHYRVVEPPKPPAVDPPKPEAKPVPDSASDTENADIPAAVEED